MNSLNEEALEKTKGGDLTFAGIAAIVTGVIFVIGVIEGIVNPKKCG